MTDEFGPLQIDPPDMHPAAKIAAGILAVVASVLGVLFTHKLSDDTHVMIPAAVGVVVGAVSAGLVLVGVVVAYRLARTLRCSRDRTQQQSGQRRGSKLPG